MEGTSLMGQPALYAQLEVSGQRHSSGTNAHHSIATLADRRDDFFGNGDLLFLSLQSQPQIEPMDCRENVS